MPELPDVTVYVESLAAKVRGQVLRRLRVLNPFLLRTALPPISAAEGCTVTGIERLGKRVVLVLRPEQASTELLLVIHLMIAGRLRWLAPGTKAPGRITLAVFEFNAGQLVLTEAGTQRRASLHLLPDRVALAAMDPGGIDVFAVDAAGFEARLRQENHTLKRALTNPQLFSGIGNAYSDEILHRARLSPLALTRTLPTEGVARLYEATRAVLQAWTDRLRTEAQHAGGWPEKVTAFHPQMAVHGRYGQPCPVCGTPVQRILQGGAPKLTSFAAPRGGAADLGAARRSAADNETNYCPRCQTGGKLLADRALSRLLKASWPKHIDDLL